MPDQRRVRVVIVENNPEFQETILELLSQDRRFQIVRVARTGEEALANLAGASPDLVLVDFRLPGLNGLETGRRIKEKYPLVIVAILTATITDYTADETMELFHRFVKEAHIDEVISKSSLTLGKIQRLVDEDS